VFDVQWVTFLDNKGRVVDPKALKKRVFHGGVEPNLRREVLYLPYFVLGAEKKNPSSCAVELVMN
jgi:hypothetical protein